MLMKKMLWLIRLMEIMATKDNNNAGEDNDGDCNICGGGRDGVQVQLVSYVYSTNNDCLYYQVIVIIAI